MRVVRFIPLSFPSLSLSLRLEPSARVYFSVNGIDCIFWDLRSAIGKSVRLIFMESIIFVHNTIKFTRSTFQRLLKDGWG